MKAALRLELRQTDGKQMDTDTFLETIWCYTDTQEITRRMVVELIDHIDVYHAEKQNGITTQRVVVYYNCIGSFVIPERKDIPNVDVLMKTRKGVAVSYSPERIAV